jgi:hypothetical protein
MTATIAAMLSKFDWSGANARPNNCASDELPRYNIPKRKDHEPANPD